MSKIRQRPTEADYINTAPNEETPVFALMGTGFTSLDENPAAQTRSRKYINQTSSSTSISGYAWTSAFAADQIPEQAAISYIKSISDNEQTGEDAETDYVKVDLDQTISNEENTYHARKRRVAVEVASNPNNDGELGISGNLLAVSDWEEGKFNTQSKTFTKTGAAS